MLLYQHNLEIKFLLSKFLMKSLIKDILFYLIKEVLQKKFLYLIVINHKLFLKKVLS